MDFFQILVAQQINALSGDASEAWTLQPVYQISGDKVPSGYAYIGSGHATLSNMQYQAFRVVHDDG